MKKKSNYLECFDYIKENRNFFYLVLVLFFISALLGYFFPEILKKYIDGVINEILNKIKEMNFFQLLVFIFQNNLKTAFFTLLSGIILGIIPAVVIFANGYILGYVAGLEVASQGYWSLWRLIPHGIFELFAVFLSFAFGLKLGFLVLTSKNKKKDLVYHLYKMLKVFLYVILPLLIIAALIETGLIFLIK